MSRSLWIGFICYFFSLPERHCLCLCTSAETATEGNTHVFSVSSQQPHRPTSIPLIAQAGKRRKKGKRSRSARIPDRVRCGVASVFLLCTHKVTSSLSSQSQAHVDEPSYRILSPCAYGNKYTCAYS